MDHTNQEYDGVLAGILDKGEKERIYIGILFFGLIPPRWTMDQIPRISRQIVVYLGSISDENIAKTAKGISSIRALWSYLVN